MEESTKRSIESTATEEYSSTKACKIPKGDAPPPLPEGAWAEWGEDAVSFVLPIRDGGGLGIFAIHPDEALVYHLVDFRYGPGDPSNAAFAVLGSRVYVVSDTGSMWFCDIEGRSAFEWKKGKNLNGSRPGDPKLFNSPMMFTFKDDLYVVDLVFSYDDEPPLTEYTFQKHVQKGWVSLRPPPVLCPSYNETLSVSRRDFLGVVRNESCLVFHVSAIREHHPFPGLRSACSCGVFHEHRLLSYKPNDGHGVWTSLGGYADKLPPWQNPLLLLVPPEKICKNGLFRPTELYIDLDELDDGLRLRIWSLLHVGGRMYCAVAFPPPGTKEPADFVVYSFGAIDHEVPEDPKSDNVQEFFMTAKPVSRTYQCFSGYLVPNGPPQEDLNQELSYPSCGATF